MAARASAGRDVPPVAHVEPGVKTPAPQRDSGGNNSVVSAEIIQSFHSVKPAKTTEKPKRQNSASDDEWRFEIKRKRRDAGRKNTGSTARAGWYYWVIRVRRSDGATLYYGTLDVLDADNPERLQKYWKRSAKRKVGKNA